MIKTYRKTANIQAEQFDGSAQMMWDYRISKGLNGHFEMMTLEGSMSVSIGDWIATGVLGEHWAIADEVFKNTYEEIKE